MWTLFTVQLQWPSTMKLWERCVAKVVHFLLYFSLLIMSLSGWYMVTAAGHPPSWFGLFHITAPGVIANKKLAYYCWYIHGVVAWIFLILVIIHTLAALKHFLINKDGILQRMWF